MSEIGEQMLADFELKMRQLMFYCDSLKADNKRLKQVIVDNEKVVSDLKSENTQLKVKYDNLKFAKSFSSQNEEDRMQAKQRLSKLVRDVDKCISILKR